MCPHDPYALHRILRSLRYAVVSLLGVVALMPAQLNRMVIEGSIQLDGGPVPAGTVVRVLRQDGSVARTIAHYPSNPSQFGARLGLQESFADGEPLGFRVVLSRRDSFEARIVGGPFVYRGSAPQDARITRLLLFRNHGPAVRRSFPDTTIRERQQLRWRVLATDEDGDTLRYRLSQSPPGASIEPLTGYVTFVPTYEDAGVYPLEVVVTDGREETTTRRARVRVTHVNRPPKVLRSVASLSTSEGRPLVIAVPGDDPDRDTLSFSLIEASYRFRLFSRTGVFEWTPGYEAAGHYTCFVVVSDGSASDTSGVFSIDVAETNRPPAFHSALHDTVIFERQEWMVGLAAVDPDGDSVRYRIDLAPEGVAVNQDGILQWTPSYDQAGNYVLIISADDSRQGTETVLRVTVLDQNRTPAFLSMIPRHDTSRIPFGRMIELTWIGARDPDVEDTLRYTLRLWGGGLDTSIVGITDTNVTLFGRGRLGPDHVYSWTAGVTDGLSEVWSPDTGSFRLTYAPITAAAVREPTAMPPRMFTLEQPGSNPTSAQTIIRYALTHRSRVDISLFTMLGERLETIVSAERSPGQYETVYDAGALASGVYLFKLEAHPLDNAAVKDFISTKKMVLVR